MTSCILISCISLRVCSCEGRVASVGIEVTGDAPLDVLDDDLKIAAIDARIEEPVGFRIAIGEITTPTDGKKWADAACVAQRFSPDLPRYDAEMTGGFVEAVLTNIQPETRRAIVGSFERVQSLDVAVGLDDDQIYGVEARRFNERVPPEQESDDTGKVADTCRRVELVPVLERRREPSAIGRILEILLARRAPVPVVVGQQEVDRRRLELQQVVEDRYGIRRQVDNDQEPGKDRAILGGEQLQGQG